MKPELFALLAAVAWAVGSYFNKKGMHDANLDPKLALAIRAAVSALIILIIAIPVYGQLTAAAQSPVGRKGLIQIILFEGIIAGLLGMLFYYTALRRGDISKVMPIAFASPFFGFALGVLYGGETFTLVKAAGAGLTLAGIIILTAF